MSGYLSVKNFEKFQHYKDRSPPWIRLYNSLLDDYEYGRLPDASKAHLNAIWLLASRYDNQIPADAEWIARRINATEPVNLDLLISAGFLVPDQACSEALAGRKQDAMPEERRAETETEESPNGDSWDIQEAFVAWNTLAGELDLPTARTLTPQRRTALRARLRDCGGIAEWRRVIAKIRGSPWLCGQNDRGWRADLDFLLQPKSFNRLMDGGYDNRKPSTDDRIAEQHAGIERALGVV